MSSFSPFRLFFVIHLMLFSYLGAESECQYDRVRLATFPRSGNHWARYLLEEATHRVTGSVYCDEDYQVDRTGKPHLKRKFPWGGYCADHGYAGTAQYPERGDTIVIKTHYPCASIQEFDMAPFNRTIRIVRNPIDTFYSQYQFHLLHHPEEKVFNSIPLKNLKNYIKKWQRFQKYWDKENSVLTIRYEDLLTHPEENLRAILSFTQLPFSEEDVLRALQQYPPRGCEKKSIDHFSLKDLQLIKKELGKEMKQFGYTLETPSSCGPMGES